MAAMGYLSSFAAGLEPDPEVLVSEWAQEERFVAPESGSPFPGKWTNARVPYLVEIMDCLSPSDPCRSVTFKKSAQVAGTEAGINLIGMVADKAPGPILVVLPTVDEGKKYNRVKLQPAIDVTPALRAKIREKKSRDERGSVVMFKRFPGGFALITGANSSAGLQMISARYLLYEEVTEFPPDVEGRGDPVKVARARSKAWSAVRKEFFNSTPGLVGACRVSEQYEESDQRRYYLPCPQCGCYQVLRFQDLKWASDVAPYGAYFVCQAHGCVIEAHHKAAMLPNGVWLKTYPGDDAPPAVVEPADIQRHRARRSGSREPGFALWQAYSPFVSWDDTVHEYLDSRGKPREEKTFVQQGLGEPYEEKGEAPDHAKLFDRREGYQLRRLPPGALFATLAIDVQGNRLEWAAYAWGVGLTSWLVDKGIIEGDPNDLTTWIKADGLLQLRYVDQLGRAWPVDAIGIDTGYLSSKVYAWVARHAGTGRVFGLDGRAGWKLPPLGTPASRDVDYHGKKVGAAMVWPVGTWDMKSELYAALRKTIEGPDEDGNAPLGYAHYPDACDQDYFRQLTAEHLAKRQTKSGLTVLEWVKDGTNEAHDIAVYNRALAHHLSDTLTPEDWAALAARRSAEADKVQLDLARLWSPGLVQQHPAGDDDRANAVRQHDLDQHAPSSDWFGDRTDNWFSRG